MSVQLQRPGINSEVKLPFRWYQHRGLKNKNRKNCRQQESVCGYRLITPYSRLLPFQFYRSTSGAAITRWQIFDLEGALVESLDETLLDIVQIVDTDNPCEYIIYDGSDLGIELAKGYYYSEIEDNDGNIFYSEDFFVSIPGVFAQELAANNEFTSSASWTLTNGSISGGEVCQVNTANPLSFTQAVPTIYSGRQYRVQVVFSSISSNGLLTVNVGGVAQSQTTQTGVLEYTFYVQAGDFTNLTITFAGIGCIEAVSLKEKTGEAECNAKLVYSHDCRFLGNIHYPSGFQAEFFFEEGVEPIALAPNIIREYDENGNKDKILRRQRRETTYTLDVGYVPMYVADALIEMSLHSNISLVLPSDLGQGEIEQVQVDVDWDEFGQNCLAKATISFQLADATVTDGCCDEELTPPDPIPCIERFCDPDLDQVEAAVNDFTYTDAEAIANGTSVDQEPAIGFGASWSGQQLCTSDEPIATGNDFIDFTKTLVDGQKYKISFTVDSILSGSLTLFMNGVNGGTINAPGDYDFFFVPDNGSPSTRFQLTASSDFLGCITFEAIYIWVPCATPLSYGWLGYEDGLVYTGSLTGTGVLQLEDISSNYVYEVEIDYVLINDGDCLQVSIGGVIVATITNGIVPPEGTYSFTYDPRDYSIDPDEVIQMALIPCDSENSFIGITGIRMCGSLY